MLLGDKLDKMISDLGGDPSTLPDNLISTKLDMMETLLSLVMRYKVLTYIGTSIMDGDNPLTFVQVKELCLDKVHFVYLKYQNRLYIPQYITADQVSFDAMYISGGKPQIHRIYIESNNSIHREDMILAKGE